MKVIFLGVGEAFDENYPNNSHLIISKTKILLDCGLTAPFQLWKYNPDQDFLDGVFISHLHADHYFGLPALLLRMWEEKRKKPFTIICQKDSKEKIMQMIELAYSGFSKKFEFDVKFIEVEEGNKIKFEELTLEFAHSDHSIDVLAIKISDKKNSISYSGDGMFNEKTKRLYYNTDVLIHETYLFDKKIIGHANVIETIEMAKSQKIKTLVLTHLNRNFRKNEIEKIKNIIKNEKLKILLPEPFEEINLN